MYLAVGLRLTLALLLVRPRWTVEPTDKQFAQGSDANIDCKADGFPQPKISWKKADGKLIIFIFKVLLNYFSTLFPIFIISTVSSVRNGKVLQYKLHGLFCVDVWVQTKT